MSRKPIPQMAWVLSGAVAVALTGPRVGAAIRNGPERSSPPGDDSVLPAAHRPAAVRQHGRFVGAHDSRKRRTATDASGSLARLDLALGQTCLGRVVTDRGLHRLDRSGSRHRGRPARRPRMRRRAAGAVVPCSPGDPLNYGHAYADPLLIASLCCWLVVFRGGPADGRPVTSPPAILVKDAIPRLPRLDRSPPP